jgi:methyl-accepting chemotaxis protein
MGVADHHGRGGGGVRGRPAQTEEQAELAAYRAAIAALIDVFDRLGRGDMEVRVPELPGPESLARLRDAINNATDMTDAYVREAGAALTAASAGEYHRVLLARGLHGAYADSARVINTARESMAEASAVLAANQAERERLAHRVQEVAVQVAAASTELGASADTLAGSTRQAVDQAEQAVETVRGLEESSHQIQEAVTLISRIAAQTRLLALNATIEAARAGDAGRGFAVVAGEVKTLADEVSRSSDNIASQVQAAQGAAGGAVTAIHGIASVIEEMDQQVSGIAAAAGAGFADQAGLSRMSESLRAELERLVSG